MPQIQIFSHPVNTQGTQITSHLQASCSDHPLKPKGLKSESNKKITTVYYLHY